MNFRPLILQILQLMFATMLMVPKINLASQPMPKCPTHCLDIAIAFPFDISSNCHLDECSLFIICSTNDNTTNPFVKFSEYEFFHRSLNGDVIISASMALDCYNQCGSINGSILELFSSKLQNFDTFFQPQQYYSFVGLSGSLKFHEADISLKPDDRAKISPKHKDRAKISAFEVLGDTKKDGILKPNGRAKIPTFLHIAFGLFLPTVGISWIFWRSKKKKIARLRQNLFVKNGGLILEKMLLRRKRCKVFTAEDLSKATDNYNESRVFDRDRNEPVYKGTLLEDGVNKLVTIKRCEKIDPVQIPDFISKLVNFSWIDHMNVAKLIGCCLETQVPLLVYEYYTDKTLYDSIHDKFSFLSWEHRLKIATETARSLLYLHSGGKAPIIHGNIKSSNILLDRGFVVKIAFPSFTGLSGTDGKKSDVYSFGVILAELLTGDEVLNFDRPRGEEFLAAYFISALKGDRMLEILEHDLVVGVNIEQLKEVSILTEMCLRERCEERPTMIEVLMKLENVFKESGARQRLSKV
ncbi:putative wall-associated receptor kinase-like 16 [Olea europaea var. sylvestris]|uniref:putative wall-associated receptor kinase-like 16 n=1 Tax=Olea europaea var. sylvestris TaxID=158386 RepID=UPI000C1CF01C|nr:putative wall-associated receptor kinase-like 16 [Olea europaea var. sylvestris]